ncbi:MAG: lactate utilization protein, partial [Clostridiales bacterium]|nr:lactate utilization protein [Candidatus Blautia equi]
MNPNRVKRNELLAQKVIKGLESRNMSGYYAADKEEALKIALSLIPEGCKVTHGGTVTVEEIGLEAELQSGKFEYCNRVAAADKRAAELFAYDADVYVGSVNAMTEDGVLVNIDGNANRVSAYAYGPKKLVLIVGMNKIAKDAD